VDSVRATPSTGRAGGFHSVGFEHPKPAEATPLSLSVIHYPHPTLRHVSKPLKRVDAELKRWIAEMFDLMYEHEGVGLAANQVDLPYRVFVANVEGDRNAHDAECVFINPVIIRGSGQAEREEGCLSIPGVYAPVSRKEKITVQAYNLAGEEVSGDFEGLFARIIQHETDHLDGRLFIDRIEPLQRADIAGQLEEFEIDWQSKRAVGEQPSDEQIAARIAELEQLRT
jgi:peptide deformylase